MGLAGFDARVRPCRWGWARVRHKASALHCIVPLGPSGTMQVPVEQMLLEEEQHPKENRGAHDDADQEEGEKKERDREQLRRHRCIEADLEA